MERASGKANETVGELLKRRKITLAEFLKEGYEQLMKDRRQIKAFLDYLTDRRDNQERH